MFLRYIFNVLDIYSAFSVILATDSQDVIARETRVYFSKPRPPPQRLIPVRGRHNLTCNAAMASKLTPKWFHGCISEQDAVRRLLGGAQRYPKQSLFLCRQDTVPGSTSHFLSCLTPDKAGILNMIAYLQGNLILPVGGAPSIAHYVILPAPAGGYVLQYGPGPYQTYSDVEQLVLAYKVLYTPAHCSLTVLDRHNLPRPSRHIRGRTFRPCPKSNS